MASETLDRVITELREIDRRSGIDRTLAIGALVLDRFFGGSAELFRDRRRNKGTSIRRLAEREDCPFSKSALNEAVGVYVAVRELPSVRTSGHITASHVAATLSLSPGERARLLERAAEEQMSVRALHAEVVALRRAAGERRGRPRADGVQHALATISGVERRLAAALAELQQHGTLDPRIRRDLRALGAQLDALVLRLRELGDARAPHTRWLAS